MNKKNVSEWLTNGRVYYHKSKSVIVGRKLPFVDVLILIGHSPNCQLKLNWHTLIHLISLFILYLKKNYILLETLLFIFIF
jgi:hypothetical protein